ncbi:hypothetical protein L1987_85472 [Smallanthus sonchifolius]|uniref:Uncharacterized protein n=1 Tax=Smallanthus sonchifolius TaxID=185202 RepID=A0ACB8XXP3_9ASTR|nr:hypothetical protein L1987_85472 [Smallanthus sonchifolius]
MVLSEVISHDSEESDWSSSRYGNEHGWNLVKRTERYYTSWKSRDDPAVGEFSVRIDIRGYPQYMLTDGKKIKFRAGPWNGLRFSGAPNLRLNPIYNFTFVLNQKEIYYQYNLLNTSVFTRMVLQPSGSLERLLWIDSKQDWSLYLAPVMDRCDDYAVCGPFGSCSIDKSPVCECLKGFEPSSLDQWRVADWSQGRRHTIPLTCDPGEGFNIYSNLKLPDTWGSWYNQTMTLVECQNICKNNCSCTAYTNLNISGSSSGCLLWFDDLIDIRTFAGTGDTLYIRLPSSQLDSIENGKRSSAWRSVRVIVPVASVVLAILISICLFYRFSNKKEKQQVLEIVCGEKNRGFVHKEHCNNLIGYVWGLHNEGRSLQLVAKCLGESINVPRVLRSIHVGLLCVQRHPEDRPTMTYVIQMLGSEGPLPTPKEPGFYVGKTNQDTTQSSSSYGTHTDNELSISMLKGR